MSIRLFGHPSLHGDDPAFVFTSPRNSLELLVFLVLHRGRAVSRDVIARTLWPDDDEAGVRARLRRNLSVLGAALPPSDVPWILATNEQLAWNEHARATIDVVEFERAARDPATYAAACDVYAGDLLEHFDDEWLVPFRDRYRARYQAMLEELVARRRAAGEFAAALSYAKALFALDPWREDVLRALVGLRFESGDRAGALRQCSDFAAALHDELGVAPMPQTLALRDAILTGQPLPQSSRPAKPSVVASAASPELVFGGRADTLAALWQAWERAASGRGGCVFVTGEAGIGKTRLLAEFARRVETGGGRVVRGGTSPHETRPYEAVAGALRSAIPYFAETGLAPLWQQTLAPLAPELVPESLDEPAPLEPVEERTRLFEATTRAFFALARTRPLTIVLEDVHAANRATVDMLRYVVGRIARQRICIVVSARDDSEPGGRPLHVAMREAIALRLATSVTLHRLAPHDVRAILAAHDDLAVVAAAGELAVRSDGHPLFLTELVRHVRSGGTAAGAAPASVAETVGARLERLSAAARSAIACGALAGATFDVETVSRVLGWDEDRTCDALAELLEARLVRGTDARAAFAYAFSHELVRDAIVARIEGKERRRLHRLIALALAGHSDRDASAAALAHHWAAAGEARRAAAAWVDAARAAFDVFANEDAVRFASHALAALPAGGDDFAARRIRLEAARRLGDRASHASDLAALETTARACGDAARIAAVQRMRVDAAYDATDAGAMERVLASGDGSGARVAYDRARLATLRSDWRAAERCAREAAGTFASEGDAGGRIDALVLLATSLAQLTRYDEARHIATGAERDVAELGDTPRRLAVIAIEMRIATLQQDFVRVRVLAQHELALGRAVGDRAAEASALRNLGVAAIRLHDHVEGLACTQAAMHVFESIGNRSSYAACESNFAAFSITLGDVERGRDILLRARERHARDGDVLREYYAWSNGGRASAYLGEMHTAVAEQRRALALAERLDSDILLSLVLGDLGEAYVAVGDAAGGVACFEEAVRIHRARAQRLSLHNNLGRLAAAYVAAGRRSDAHAAATELLERYEADSSVLEEPAEILWAVAQAFAACDDAARAARAAQCARAALAARLVAFGDSPYRDSYAALPWHRALCANALAAPLVAHA